MKETDPLINILRKSIEDKDRQIKSLLEENELFHDTLNKLTIEALRLDLLFTNLKDCKNFEEVTKCLEQHEQLRLDNYRGPTK